MRTVIAEKSLGTRTILNTNLPVTAYLEREQIGRTTRWYVTVACNGIADYHHFFKTRRHALVTYESL